MYAVGFETCQFEIESRRPPTSSVVAFQYVYIYSCSNGSISVQFGRNYFHQKKISAGVDFNNLRFEVILDGRVSSDDYQMQKQLKKLQRWHKWHNSTKTTSSSSISSWYKRTQKISNHEFYDTFFFPQEENTN